MEKNNQNKKILIVEDDSSIIVMYAMKFKEHGFHVLQAGSGDVGLEIAAKERPDIILLDVMMPKLDGFNVLKRIKENFELKHIPVIMLTNLGQESDIKKGSDLGAAGYMVKASFTPSQVMDKILKILNSNK